MTELEHDIDALEAKLRTAIEEVNSLDAGLLEGVLDVIRCPAGRPPPSTSSRWD